MCREPAGVEQQQQQQQAEQVPTILLDGAHDMNHGTHGFFNHVPGTGAWICDNGPVRGFHLLSSNWVDWTAFEVTDEKLGSVEYPKLQSTNNEPIRVRGVVSGSWIPDTLEGRFVMDRVFVVDAMFIRNGTDTHQSPLDFLIYRDATEDGAKFKAERELRILYLSTLSGLTLTAYLSIVTSAEKRSLIGSLNPSVFRYADMSLLEGFAGAAWIKKPKKKKPGE